ncbi:MAG: ComEC family competence protein [Bacteroidales bacterium]|nr:ComEC family competence protein [Bacteroidales bacterium]
MIPFIIGIIIQDYFHFNILISIIGFSIFFILSLIVKSFKGKQKSKTRFLFMKLACVCFVFMGMYITENKYVTIPIIDNSKAYYGVISEPLEEKEKSIKTQITVLDLSFSEKFEILAYFEKDSLLNIEMGDLLYISSKIDRIKSNGNPLEFDYADYMSKNGIYFRTYINNSNYQILKNGYKKGLRYYSCKIRNYLLSIYRKSGFSEKELGVLEALTLGYKNDLDEETKSAFQSSGAMHVLAVSGLHTGIIMMITDFLLKFLKKNRRQKIIKCGIICIIIWLFAAITGFSSSVNRAALMFSIMSIGKSIDRNSSTYNSLAVSCFILLMINPYLIFNVGFGLSYLAVLSIISCMPLFEKIQELSKSVIIKYFLGIIVVSISAQIGTSVLSICTFRQFPTYFLLTNIIIIPVAYAIMILAIALLITNSIPIISTIIFYPLKYSVKFMTESVSWIESLPGSCIKNIFLPNSSAILLYLVLFSIIVFIFYKQFYWVKLSAIGLLLVSLIYLSEIKGRNADELLIVYNCNKASAIQIGNKLITNSQNIDKYFIDMYIPPSELAGYKNIEIINQDSLSKISDNFFMIDKKIVGIIDNDEFINIEPTLKIDYLILSKNVECNLKNLSEKYKPEIIILDSSNSKKYREQVTKESLNKNINIYDVNVNGAFILGDAKKILKKY